MIERIARGTAVSCVAMAVLFGLWKQSIVAGAAVLGGGLLIAISFWAIRGGVDALVRQNGRKSAAFSLVKFFTRHAIVALAAYGMMVCLHLDPIGLLAGVSSLAVAVAVEGLKVSRWRRFL